MHWMCVNSVAEILWSTLWRGIQLYLYLRLISSYIKPRSWATVCVSISPTYSITKRPLSHPCKWATKDLNNLDKFHQHKTQMNHHWWWEMNFKAENHSLIWSRSISPVEEILATQIERVDMHLGIGTSVRTAHPLLVVLYISRGVRRPLCISRLIHVGPQPHLLLHSTNSLKSPPTCTSFSTLSNYFTLGKCRRNAFLLKSDGTFQGCFKGMKTIW
jgi:hypothetical protein